MLPGWSEPLDACRSFADLPQAAQDYVAFIEEQTGVRVGYIAALAEATIERKPVMVVPVPLSIEENCRRWA